MALNFNTNPYYDDFDSSNNYHRILFRPGYAVQARELTQLQTQIQDQVNRFGQHVFTNGSIVTGGARLFDNSLTSIKIGSTYSGTTVTLSNFVGKTITGVTSGTIAVVKSVADITATDPKTLIVKVISGDEFTAGENITTSPGTAYNATIQTSSPFNDAMVFSIDSGIFFVDGKFIYLEAQTINVDKYSNSSSKNIGLVLEESIITSDDDLSILDRAQGSPNYAAPGADRYSAALTLTIKELTDNVDNFIEIARVVDGALVVNQDKTIYSEIGKELARRTFDESGDYTVKNWPIQILDDVSSPIDLPSKPAVGGDDTKFTVALDPGKAYVKGYEFGTINQEFLTLDRARDTEQADNLDVATSYGNYVYVTSIFGAFSTNTLPSASPYSSVEIHNVARASVSSSSTKLGTAKVRYLNWVSGTPGTSAIYKMYLFDIVMDSGKFFKDAESIIINSSSPTSGANINELSKVGGSAGGDAFLAGADSPGLVFKIPNDYVETIRDSLNASVSDYTIQRTFFAVDFSGGNPGTCTTASSGERFIGSGLLSDTLKATHFHVVVTEMTNAGGTGLSVGSVVPFDDASSRSIDVKTASGSSTQTVEFNIDAPSFSGKCVIIATINRNLQTEKTKTLSGYSAKVIGTGSTGGLNTTIGGKDSLALSDIYDVLAIYNTGSTDPTTVAGTIVSGTGALTWGGVVHTDVTSNYTVDDGQRAEIYDHGSLILNGTAPTSSHYLLVVYRNFSHGGSDGFLSVDSYGIDYADIPQFTDPASGVVYELRDCIDFRPRRADGSTSLTNGQVPDPDGTFNTDYRYYLSRIDKIIATSDRQFTVKRGVSALYPTIPTDESNGMAIYNVIIPPYTDNVRDVQIKYVENKRYTMRDIGRLEKRISNLEYYTQLSLLEKQAKDTSIPDASNFEKFKNGFVVDTFSSADIFAASATAWSERRWGWWAAWFNGSNNWSGSATSYNENSIAQAADSDFKAAIDPLNQELRAPFEVNFSKFDTSTLTNTAKTGDLVTLDYTETVVVDQSLSTTWANINPFNVLRFVGSITLEPSFDQWVDTQYLPEVNKVVDVQIQDAADKFQREATGGRGPAFRVTGSRTTTVTNVVGSTTSSLGTNVVDIQYVPFIRSSTVIGVSRLFKPKARLYPFIENTDIASYIKPLTLIEVQNHTGALFDDRQGAYEALSFRTGSASGTETGTARTALYSQPSTADSTKRLLTIYDDAGTITVGKYVVGLTGGGSGVVTAVTTYALGNSLIPDEYGNIGFEFQIPANTFKTGERTIRLIDNSLNDTEAQESIGETKYTAIGTLQTKQETILTTRTLQNQKTVTQIGYWYDPLGQTFLVDPTANPQGFHLSSVDVYFKSKSSTVPVTMEIRRTVNGYPEAIRTIPFSECILAPEQVIIQGGGTNSTNDAIQPATTFNFANPIHLTPGEYAIVLVSQSNEYQVYVSEMGKTILGGTTKVDKQPYLGSLFYSQNASTWEPDQNKDLKFKIRRANFESTGTAEFTIQDPATVSDYQTLFTNVSTVLPTGTNVVWKAKAYNQDTTFDTDWAPFNVLTDINYSYLKRLAAASGIGGTPSLRLQASLTTTNSKVSPVIDAASLSVVTALNSINNDYSTESYYAQIVFDGASAVDPSANSITYSTHGYVTGDLLVYNANGGTVIGGLTDGASYYAIRTGADTIKLATTLTLAYAGTPIDITLDGVGASHSLKKPTKSGGSALARYITKPINLASGFEASNLAVTVDINKPSGTDVKVYYRTLPTEKTTPISDEYWILMNLESSVPSSSSNYDFREHRYFPSGAFDDYGVPQDNPISARFNTFQIKIVMLSTSEASTPRLRDLRIIALDS
jgi:hypothetical protein